MAKKRPKPQAESAAYRDRVVGFERLLPTEIEDHPKNKVAHPPEQRVGLQWLLGRIGIADAAIVYKTLAGKWRLIDGHLRRSEIDQPIPCLVLDVSDAEADVLVAGMDAVGELRERDETQYQALLDEIRSAFPDADDLLKQIEEDYADFSVPVIEDEPAATYPIVADVDEGYDYVLIFCRTNREFATLKEMLKLKEKAKRDTPQRAGLCRVLEANEFFRLWAGRKDSG